jgi:putative SOS response-associated peptidase YedK
MRSRPFREALKFRRCLIPADGFYEWKRVRKAKQPYCFEVHEGQVFAFAGLWERWEAPGGTWIKRCTILTTSPNALTSAVHDRMPVIFHQGDYGLWLDPGMKDSSIACEFLKPFDATLRRCYAVSSRVNQVQYDHPECCKPVEEHIEPQAQLFV